MSKLSLWRVAVVALLIAALPIGATAKTTAKTPKPAAKVKSGATCPKSAKSPAPKQNANKNKTNSKAKPKPAKPVAVGLPKLLDLGATTCIPCKMMTPILDELSKEYKGKLTVEFINVQEKRDAVDKYKIQAIPTQIFFDGKGKELYRHTGFFPKAEILAKFKELGIKLTK